MNPNRAGMREVLGLDAEASLWELASGKGPIGGLFVVGNIPNFAVFPVLKAVLDRTESVVFMDFAQGELLRYGTVVVVLPTLTTFEKSGTLVNRQGIHQKFMPVMEPVTFGRHEVGMFLDLARGRRRPAPSACLRVPPPFGLRPQL